MTTPTPTTPEPTLTARLAGVLRSCRDSPDPFTKFNAVVLRRPPYWRAQRAICRAIQDPTVSTVVVPAGHSVGKSYMAAGLILAWWVLYKQSLSVSTSPSNAQLNLVLWGEIRKAKTGSPLLRHAGRLTRVPNNLDFGDRWQAIGYATDRPERLQGIHAGAGPLLNVVDEASGIVDPGLWATLKSLKPRKTLLIGNPLRDHGYFHDTCKRAEDDPAVRLIRIPSTSSPDCHLEHSPRGLADAAWLREMAADYGEDSQVYRVRVLAQFPDSSADALVPKSWLDRCERAVHVPGGRRRLAIDVSEGVGNDEAVLVARDDNGVLGFRASNRWSFEVQATEAALLCQRFGIDPGDVSYDAGGCGADFGNRLEAVGLYGCKPYRGGRTSRSPKYVNLRTACLWQLRRRLDPKRTDDLNRPLPPFAIPPEYLKRLRPELREITYTSDEKGRLAARPGDEVREALRRSPDYTDALSQSFLSQ